MSAQLSRRCSSLLFILSVVVLGFGSMALPASAQNRLNITPTVLGTPGGTVTTGNFFRYRISYSCDLISLPSCNDATVTVDLPPELIFDSASFPPGNVVSASHDGSALGGRVTFTFRPTVPAGNAGDLDITLFFPIGPTANGTPTTQIVGAASSSGTGLQVQVANLPLVTAAATPQPVLTSILRGRYVDDCPSTSSYEITLGPRSNPGSLNFLDAEVVLTLPPGVTNVVPRNGGTYSAGANTVTWSGLGAIAVGSGITVRVDVSFESPTFSDGQIVNASATANIHPLGEPPGFLFGPVNFTDTLREFSENPTAAVAKSFGERRPSGLSPAAGQSFTYQVTMVNAGNQPLTSLVVADDGNGAGADIDPNLTITSVSTGAYRSPPVSVTVNVTGDMGSAPSLTSPNGTTNSELDLTAGALLPGERAIRIEWVFNGGAPVGMSPSTLARVAATVNPSTPDGAIIRNHVSARWTADLTGFCGGTPGPTSGGAANNFPFDTSPSYVYLRPTKLETTPGPYFPGDTVGFGFEVTNDPLSSDPASGVVVTDLLPEALQLLPGSETFDGGATGVSLGLFEEIPNYGGTGRTLLRWTLSGDLDPGETVTMGFDTELRRGVIFGNLLNTMGMTIPGGPVLQECAGTSIVDVVDLDGDGDTMDRICTSDQGIEVAAIAQLASTKLVRGQCNSSGAGFLPGLATDDSLPGGIVDWRVEVQNIETVPMENVVIVDILPFVGDTGVRTTSPRLSLFRTFLSEPIAPPPGGAVFYSLSGNPCRPEVGGLTTDCDVPNWTPIPPTPISAAQSFKVEFGDRVLNPLDVLAFSWRMVLPADAPTDGSEAFNSFAFGATRRDDGGFLSAEPNKVGVDATCVPVPPNNATLGDFVWIDDNGNGLQDPGEPGLRDVRVELFSPGPDGLPRTGDDALVLSTLTADDALGNPGKYIFSALAPGSYYVQFTPPANFPVTTQGAGDPTLDSDADPTTAATDVVVLGPSQSNLDLDIGLLPPVTSSLGNYVWYDRNGDGVQNEPLTDGANGVTVELFGDDGDGIPEPGADDGAPLRITVTADDDFGNPGFYTFKYLAPGTAYFVRFTLPSPADSFTLRDATGDDMVDSDADPADGTTEAVTLAPGESNLNFDAGLLGPSGTLSLGNLVWVDDDGNGVIDAPTDNDGIYDPLVPEAAINGVRVNLYLDENGDGMPQVSEYFGTTTTQTLAGKDGRYRFDDLAPGDYITEVDSSNFVYGGPLDGFVTVSGNEPTPDPDDDRDNDDNGDALGASVISQAVTLMVGDEPTADADDDLEDDSSINFAVDFGFVPGPPRSFDLGDAPDVGSGTGEGNYQTVILDDGASHEITGPGGPFLGVCVDSDSGTEQSVEANADDLSNAFNVTVGACVEIGDDEDGASFSSTVLMAGGSFDLTLTSGSAIGCLIGGWIDWNRDGAFDDFPPEKIFTDVTAGVFPGISVPAFAMAGPIYARFRCSSAGGDAPMGPAADGEVEDYLLQVAGTDLGDAPDVPYGTLLASGGPVHLADPVAELYLGTCVDTEDDGQPTVGADGDDANLGGSRLGDCIDDEDGVVFDTNLIAGSMASVTLIASRAGRVDAWIDTDGVGGFDAADQILVNVPVVAGTNVLNFPVPGSAPLGATYARFRVSSVGGLAPGGMAADGEVEDYSVFVSALDFGDAPNSYSTLLADGGAYHGVDPTASLFLGSCADTEADAQLGSGDGLGDDGAFGSSTAGTCVDGDDEDGVTFDTAITACKSGEVTVTASAPGLLDAWIDFGGDGSFGEASDQIFASHRLGAGANTLSFLVPCTATAGTSFARFRFSTAGGLSFNGGAGDGEVEDHSIGAVEADFGDAPDTYGTRFAAGGALHGLDVAANLYLGACVDGEADGQPTAGADGDDLGVGTSNLGTCAGGDDEDGVVFDTALAVCQQTSLTVTASTAGFLDAWVDFDGDGTFGGADDQIFVSEPLVAGANSLSLRVPCGAAPGATYSRFRVSSRGGLRPTGTAPNGEVEDLGVTVLGTDFGDAPDSYLTLAASGGAYHGVDSVAGVYLGACVDTERDGQVAAGDASGDDGALGSFTAGACVGGDDEEGVTFDTAITACKSGEVTVTASAAGRLDAWFDFGGDGSFAETGDQIFINQPLVAGANTLSFLVPCDLSAGATYARFRLSTAGGLSFGGYGADGEVEDYRVGTAEADFGDAPDTYGTTVAAGGALHGLDTAAGLYLGACVDSETDGQPSAGADGDDQGTGISSLGICAGGDDGDGIVFDTVVASCQQAALTVTASAAGFLDAWVDFDGDGTFAGADDQIFVSQPLVAGANSLSIQVPCGVAPGATYSRFRFSSIGGLGATGSAPDGEVEDHGLAVLGGDFGDAPDSYGTTFAAGGAVHSMDPATGLYLGTCVDGEANGYPSVQADGDNLAVGTSNLGPCAAISDEDGVTFDSMISACQQADMTVTASAAGFLNAWIDFDGDGTFAGPTDQIFASQPLTAGANSLSIQVPCGAISGDSYARFRFSSVGGGGGGLGATGSAPDGEVEDYPMAVGIEDPILGIAKALINLEQQSENEWAVYLEMVVDNAGNVPLADIQVVNDFAAVFADAEGFAVDFVMSSEFTVNPNFDGITDLNLLTGTDSLEVGESGVIEIQILLMPGLEEGPYVCSAVASSISPSGVLVDDISQDGPDSDPDGNGDPTDNNDPTIIILSFPPVDIPTLGTWGFMALTLLLALAGMASMRRRRRV